MGNTRNCRSEWDDPRDAKGFFLRHRGCRDQIITMKQSDFISNDFYRLLKTTLVLLRK